MQLYILIIKKKVIKYTTKEIKDRKIASSVRDTMMSKDHDYNKTDIKLLVEIEFMYSSRDIIIIYFWHD